MENNLKKDIFERIKNAKDNKEKTRLLEKFWLKEKRSDEENIHIIREGVKLLEKGDDNEKIIALQVISRAGGFPLSIQLKEIAESIGKDQKINYRKSIDYDELLEIVNMCLKFSSNDNGNLRIASANCLNHLRSYLEGFDYVELFYNLLSLRNFFEKNDKRKIKSIEFCLDKVWCPILEEMIEDYMPKEVKKMKITNEGKTTEQTKELENFVNNMINETEKYIKDILTLRGQRLFIDNLVPYTENMRILQLDYEYQKILRLAGNKEIRKELLSRYLNLRFNYLLDNLVESLEKINEKESWMCVIIDVKNKEVKPNNLQAVYQSLKNMKRDIETNFLLNL